MKSTEESRERLALAIVDAWDMDTLIQYAVDKLTEYYKTDKKQFDIDYKEFITDCGG